MEQRLADQRTRWNASFLLVIFLSPIFSLFLSLHVHPNDVLLPACCRLHGKHHCFMRDLSAEGPSTSKQVALSPVPQRCPFSQLASGPHASVEYGSPLTLAMESPGSMESYCETSETSAVTNLLLHANYTRGPPVFSQSRYSV
jgi:hypothetical protein